MKVLGAVVGSTSAIAALLFYFGYSRAYYFYDYLGIDSSVLELTTRDYVQLSVDGLFRPIMVISSCALALIWAQAWIGPAIAEAVGVRSIALVASLAGGLLFLNGLSRLLAVTPLNQFLLAPVSLAIGATLALYGSRLYRKTRASKFPEWVSVGEWAAYIILLGVCMFWIANDYSAEVGQARARQYVYELPSLPTLRVYSTNPLNLKLAGVTEVRCREPEARYRYRYDGLKLVLHSNERYLLLPERWTREDGVAILLPRSSDTLLQFSPAGVALNPTEYC